MLQSKWSLNIARSEPIYTTAWFIKRGAEIGSGSPQRRDMGPPCHIDPPICVGRAGFQSVRRAAASEVPPWPERVRRLECVAAHGQQRGAGNLRDGPSKVTGPSQAHRPRSPRAVLPNPSLKRSANGRPPGPGPRYGVHFLSPGPGVLPSSPA